MADKMNTNIQKGVNPASGRRDKVPFLTFKKRIMFFSLFMLPFITFCIFAVMRESASFYDKLFFYPSMLALIICYIWVVIEMNNTKKLYQNGIVKTVKVKDFRIRSHPHSWGAYQYFAVIKFDIYINGKKIEKKASCRVVDLKRHNITLKKGMGLSILQSKENPNLTAMYFPKLVSTLI